MSFQASAREIWLEDGCILVAVIGDGQGNWDESRINLNDLIGNEDGWFSWDGVNFANSARNIRLEGTLLTADLPKRDGGYRERQGIQLNDRIANIDGRLQLV
ncbi:Cyanovirin-N [Trichoderma chlorosporum]